MGGELGLLKVRHLKFKLGVVVRERLKVFTEISVKVEL